MSHAYADDEREAVYKVMRERRDVRHGYLPDPIPDEVLTRVLSAGHLAGSVGLVQPWDFLVLRDTALRRRVLDHVLTWRREYAESLPEARARKFLNIKVEAILDTPVNVVVTADTSRGGRHVLGARTQPYAAAQSATLAVQNIWLAARAEGIGVNMMGFFQERELAAMLGLPEHLSIVAYLCLGYVRRFPPASELELANWGVRRPLSWVIHHDAYGRRGLPGGPVRSLLAEIVDAVAERAAAARSATDGDAAAGGRPADTLADTLDDTVADALAEQLDDDEADLAARLTRLAGAFPPPAATPPAVAVFAADRGEDAAAARRLADIAAERDPLTQQAVDAGAELAVVDLGSACGAAGVPPGVTSRRVPSATPERGVAAPLTEADAQAAVEAGIETARELVISGYRCLAVVGTHEEPVGEVARAAAPGARQPAGGERGPGERAPDEGASDERASGEQDPGEQGFGERGTDGRVAGESDAGPAQALVELLLRQRPAPPAPLAAVAETGAVAEAAAAGFLLAAAAHRVPVVVSGVFGNAAALLAQRLAPASSDACVPLEVPGGPPPRGLTARPFPHDATREARTAASLAVAALERVGQLSLALREAG